MGARCRDIEEKNTLLLEQLSNIKQSKEDLYEQFIRTRFEKGRKFVHCDFFIGSPEYTCRLSREGEVCKKDFYLHTDYCKGVTVVLYVHVYITMSIHLSCHYDSTCLFAQTKSKG